MKSVGFPKPAAAQDDEMKWYCDDEEVTLRVQSKRFTTSVGTMRKFPESRLAAMFPEDEPVAAQDEFVVDR